MTYGWAILIIAVVLGVLFQLGIFSGGALTPKAQPGACSVQRLLGQVSLEGECQGQLPQFVGAFLTGYQSCSGQPCIGGAIVTGTPSSPSAILNPASQVSVTAWVYTVGGSGWQRVVRNTKTETNGYWLDDDFLSSVANGRFCIGAVSPVCAPKTWSPNKWVFLAGTYNGVYLSLYVNASNPGVAADTSAISSSVCSLSIGGDAGSCDGFGNFFNGSIANVQVYNTSLSQNELKALYQEGIGGAPINLQNLVGWWPLNGNANDYSGYNNNGQTYNGIFNSSWNSQYTPP